MLKIVLFCNAGMSTSLLVERMKAAAAEDGFECEICAHGMSSIATYGPDADIVLLGPQVRFNLEKVKQQLPEKLVGVIDMKAYGTMDGRSVLESVKKLKSCFS